jgi:cytochrome c
MKDFSDGGKKHWDYQLISEFITKPKAEVPGTAMGFAGLSKIEERADVIAYLRTLSDNPEPLPSPDAAKPAAAEGGAAKPAEGAKPADNGAKPAGEAKPAEGAAKPAEGTEKPAEGSSAPKQ